MDTQEIFKNACGIIKEAVEADNQKEYEKALKLYQKALQYFVHLCRYEKNEQLRQTYELKAQEYMSRAEELKTAIKHGTDPDQGQAGGGSAVAKHGSGGGGDQDQETKKLQGALQGSILEEKPNVKWSDVAGLEKAKAALKEAVVMPVRFPQLFTGKRKPWKGILMYGPPGTGKSYLAKAVATEADSTFFSVSSSDLVSKWQGESERLVRNLFDMAREKKPAIIFIDEIDSLCSSRSEGENDASRRIKTEFLVQMQGVGKGDDGILVLGATNTPWEIDAAMRRRFEKRVYIPLPSVGARAEMFRLHLGDDTPHNLTSDDFEELGRMTEGFSGSDVNIAVRQALMEPLRKCEVAKYFRKLRNGLYVPSPLSPPCPYCTPDLHRKPAPRRTPCRSCGCERLDLWDLSGDSLSVPDVTLEDFMRVVKNAKASVSNQELESFEKWTAQFGEDGV